jgi:hypothetical protein
MQVLAGRYCNRWYCNRWLQQVVLLQVVLLQVVLLQVVLLQVVLLQVVLLQVVLLQVVLLQAVVLQECGGGESNWFTNGVCIRLVRYLSDAASVERTRTRRTTFEFKYCRQIPTAI